MKAYKIAAFFLTALIIIGIIIGFVILFTFLFYLLFLGFRSLLKQYGVRNESATIVSFICTIFIMFFSIRGIAEGIKKRE